VKRTAIAVSLWLVSLGLAAISVGLIATSWDVPLPKSWGFRGFTSTFAILFSTVGLLIVRRHERHLVGWILIASGMLSGLQALAEEYLIASFFTHEEPLPGAQWLGWLNVWIWVLTINFVIAIALTFPDGRLASRAWRWVVALGIVAVVVTILGAIADPLQVSTNMLGIPPPYDPAGLGLLTQLSAPLFTAGFAITSFAAIAATASVVLRYRRSRGVERQQIKWFAYGVAAIGISITVNVFAQAAVAAGSVPPHGTPWDLAQYSLIVAMWLVPVSIGIAILRYRLYDIDLVINRTIVYAVVSAILGATYVATVVSFQAVLRPITGGSELAVAVSTLLVVALFQPIRTQVQDAVDRRFYRSRYDAGRTLDAFTARLRGDVDLDSVRTDLVSVLHETVRPTHASVWLREGQG
jgi:hypothetical protein